MSNKMSKLYIPKKVHVGFQERDDTYTKKLGYVIYEDEKGTLRKERSWQGWRNAKIEPKVFDNTPSRFVLNKGIQRHGYFGSGRSVIRVYDTRDFEFEISVDNLIGILMHSDVSKRDIVEECVFAWYGTELVLLPTNSEEYQNSVKYTEKQSQCVSAKSLTLGHVYSFKKRDDLVIYMGYHTWYDYDDYYRTTIACKGKKHIFYNTTLKRFEVPSVSTLAAEASCEPHASFAGLNSSLHASMHLCPPATITIANHRYTSHDILHRCWDGTDCVASSYVRGQHTTAYAQVAPDVFISISIPVASWYSPMPHGMRDQFPTVPMLRLYTNHITFRAIKCDVNNIATGKAGAHTTHEILDIRPHINTINTWVNDIGCRAVAASPDRYQQGGISTNAHLYPCQPSSATYDYYYSGQNHINAATVASLFDRLDFRSSIIVTLSNGQTHTIGGD